ncbi:MAG: hypothetical protein KDA41_11460 [Planctomycetales bacterium]|nr:hypothetical protein [Planctomycetales bacterium]
MSHARYVPTVVVSLFALALLAICGCGGGEPAAPATPASGGAAGGQAGGGAAGGPKSYALADLSHGLDGYLPPLDGGRVEIATPQNWQVGSRQSGYVVWFHQFRDPKLLPQVRITVEDAAGAPQDATPADVAAYAKWVEGDVQKQLKAGEKLLEPVVPLILGPNAFARYVRAGKIGGAIVERQILTTTQKGRTYHIELIVFSSKLRENRDAAYAVAASMKFDPEQGSLAPESSFPTPPAESESESE